MPAQRSSTRILAVTAALLASGAAFGALAAVAAAAIGFPITGQTFGQQGMSVLPLVAGAGAVLGAPLLPVTMWLFLRRVPLGLALLGTFVGAVAGGVGGWILPGYPDDVMFGPRVSLLSLQSVHAMIGGAAGFALAAVILRLKFSAARATHRPATPTAV